ncbi:MAG: transcription antitermination factor NusB [Endomicrobiia bacterium]
MVEKGFKKVGLRRKSRVVTLNVLYLVDNCNLTVDNCINTVFSQYENYPDSFKKFSAMLVTGTIQNKNIIDKIIEKYLHNWTLDRMASVDKNILRLATFELLVFLETPVNVIINEAIEIAKEYSTKDSGRFVNGLLDQIKNVRTNTKLLQQFKSMKVISDYDYLQDKPNP